MHSRTSHMSFVTRTVSRGGGDSASRHLSVASRVRVPVSALPEWLTTSRALGVVVRGAGTKALLLLVVADQKQLDHGGDEEEEDVEDGDGEAGGV